MFISKIPGFPQNRLSDWQNTLRHLADGSHRSWSGKYGLTYKHGTGYAVNIVAILAVATPLKDVFCLLFLLNAVGGEHEPMETAAAAANTWTEGTSRAVAGTKQQHQDKKRAGEKHERTSTTTKLKGGVKAFRGCDREGVCGIRCEIDEILYYFRGMSTAKFMQVFPHHHFQLVQSTLILVLVLSFTLYNLSSHCNYFFD